jgi:hypothetical protein
VDDWTEWKKLVLFELKSLRHEMNSLKKDVRIASAFWVSIGGFIAGISAFIWSKLGH